MSDQFNPYQPAQAIPPKAQPSQIKTQPNSNKSKKHFFTSESVTEGHPDKICDQISDAVYDEMLKQDTNSHAGIECFCTTDLVLVGGEAKTKSYVDLQKVVRRVFSFKPKKIIKQLDLKRPIYEKTAAYGHFGREIPEFSWERTDQVSEIKKLAGI